MHLLSMTLTPLSGTVLMLVLILCGRQFRETWKAQGPGWAIRAWAWGVPAALSFAALALLPLTH